MDEHFGKHDLSFLVSVLGCGSLDLKEPQSFDNFDLEEMVECLYRF